MLPGGGGRGVISGLVLLLCLSGATVMMADEVRRSTQARISSVSVQVSDLLGEAMKAGLREGAYLNDGCSLRLRRHLQNVADRNPYVDGLYLWQAGGDVCPPPEGVAADGRLSLIPDSLPAQAPSLRLHPVPGKPPVLTLRLPRPDGVVAVDVNTRMLRQWLRGAPGRPALVLVADGKSMDVTGTLRPVADTGQAQQPEALYTLAADPVRAFSWRALLFSGGPWLLLSICATGLAVQFCHWLMSGRQQAKVRLQMAILRGQIIPWYQPVVDSRTGALTGCEVLARWQVSPERMIPPDDFIALAETSGLIIPMTRRLMRQVAQDLAPSAGLLPDGFHLGINISRAHARAPGFIRDCRRLQGALAGCRVQIVAEVTERERFEPTGAMLTLLNGLRRTGVRVALDDFGTGYSGLASLETLPADILKLDRSFTSRVGEVQNGPGRPLMAEAVTALAQRLSLEVVAEGVETPAQQAWMVRHGVRWLQGYLFSGPLPAPAFIAWCRQQHPGNRNTLSGNGPENTEGSHDR
ncbi:EAL domain-containing protein [Trabulsiella odontotermitis]|uniref:EAL domain-containing protein n=1 Tax=Trabulsiella odontotermitis TaxID=379893 RepID=UPI000676A245|nr:EAL domain-containing protein [Trabulsiella odontotermitis]